MGKTPSRKRYEEKNPVVAFRVSKETKQALDELAEQLDTTKKAWFEQIIDEKKQDVDEAWQQGYETAKDEYMVKVPCVICGKLMPVERDDMKGKIADLLYSIAHEEPEKLFSWCGHRDCI